MDRRPRLPSTRMTRCRHERPNFAVAHNTSHATIVLGCRPDTIAPTRCAALSRGQPRPAARCSRNWRRRSFMRSSTVYPCCAYNPKVSHQTVA